MILYADVVHAPPGAHGADPSDGPQRTSASDVHVLFCADAEYFEHLAVAARSLVANTSAASITFHVALLSLPTGAGQRLIDALAGDARVKVRFHLVDPEAIEGFHVDGHVTRETYLRLVAPLLLPAGLRRVLYLDADLVVLGDVVDLWNLDLAGAVVGAAPNYPMTPAHRTEAPLAAFGIAGPHTYVNAGVLLIDLDAWRSAGVTADLLRCVATWGTRLRWHDQDALNITLHRRIRLIDCAWNFQAIMARLGPRSFPVDYAETRHARRRPAIVHYTGPDKPWRPFSMLPWRATYLRYRRATPWSGPTHAYGRGWQRVVYPLEQALARAGVDYWFFYLKTQSVARHLLSGLGAGGVRRSAEAGK